MFQTRKDVCVVCGEFVGCKTRGLPRDHTFRIRFLNIIGLNVEGIRRILDMPSYMKAPVCISHWMRYYEMDSTIVDELDMNEDRRKRKALGGLFEEEIVNSFPAFDHQGYVTPEMVETRVDEEVIDVEGLEETGCPGVQNLEGPVKQTRTGESLARQLRQKAQRLVEMRNSEINGHGGLSARYDRYCTVCGRAGTLTTFIKDNEQQWMTLIFEQLMLSGEHGEHIQTLKQIEVCQSHFPLNSIAKKAGSLLVLNRHIIVPFVELECLICGNHVIRAQELPRGSVRSKILRALGLEGERFTAHLNAKHIFICGHHKLKIGGMIWLEGRRHMMRTIENVPVDFDLNI